MKFGGTSVGSAEAIENVYKIVENEIHRTNGQKVIVVLSAVGGITNLLVSLIENLKNKVNQNNDYNLSNQEHAINDYELIIENINSKHINIINNLGVLLDKINFDSADKFKSNINQFLKLKIQELLEICKSVIVLEELSLESENLILSFGEIISSEIVYNYFIANEISIKYLDITNHLIYDSLFYLDNKNEKEFIKFKNKHEILDLFKNNKVIITQGFIARNSQNQITNLGRGGSDYSAALIASEFDANELQIWTDVSGIKTGDPRIIFNTKSIAEIDFKSVSLMAYWGAKVLHPKTILPTISKNIITKILNTFDFGNVYTTIIPKSQNNSSNASIIVRDNLSLFYSDNLVENLKYLMLKNYENSYIYLIENSSKQIIDNFDASNNSEDNTSKNVKLIYSIIINNLVEIKLNSVFEILDVYYKKYSFETSNMYKKHSFFNFIEYDNLNKVLIIGIDINFFDKNIFIKLANDLHNKILV